MLTQHSQSDIGLFNQCCSRHLLAVPLEACELEHWTLKRPIVQTIFEEIFFKTLNFDAYLTFALPISWSSLSAFKMDIVLEAADTYLFDRFWATVLPATSAIVKHNATTTFSSMREGATIIPQQRWTWEPATSYFSFPPTEYAWQSSWGRDKLERQYLELFLLVW